LKAVRKEIEDCDVASISPIRLIIAFRLDGFGPPADSRPQATLRGIV
jgi:hypothetical protein